MATSQEVEMADHAGRKGSGPGVYFDDPGIAYPPTDAEKHELARSLAVWAFRGHECDWEDVFVLGQERPAARLCFAPGHRARVLAGRDLWDMLFAPMKAARSSHH